MILRKLLLVLLFVSCSSLKTEQESLHFSLEKKDYKESLTVLNKKKYLEKENKLLRLIELANVYIRSEQFSRAISILEEADQLYLELYAKSIKEKILAGIFSDNSKSFYGKIYERSAIFHLQISAMLKLYSSGFEKIEDLKGNISKKVLNKKERRRFLLKAKAVVLAWNGFYEDLQRSGSKSYFLKDYHQKFLSALIHIEVGTRNDRNTALILLEQLYRNLKKVTSLYPSYSENYEANTSNYLNERKLRKNKTTVHYDRLNKLVQKYILKLSKKINRRKFNKYVKKFKWTKKELKSLGKRTRILLFDRGLVDLMQTKEVAYNLTSAFSGIEDPAARAFITSVGASTLSYFAFGTLGLNHYYYNNQDGYIIYSDVNTKLAQHIGVEIKVPYLPVEKKLKHPHLKIRKKGEDKVVYEDSSLAIINSYKEKMGLSTQEYANGYFQANAVNLGIKYALALIAAYKTYQSLKKNDNPLASTIAMSQYFLSTKGILATQAVDVRHIVGLSAYDYLVELELPAGDYIVDIFDPDTQEKSDFSQEISIPKGKMNLFSL